MLKPFLYLFTIYFANGDWSDPIVYSQFLGTHDSSHARPQKWDASTWFQYNGGLEGQLDLGVRVFEFTIWDSQLTISSWHPYVDSLCATLTDCLTILADWHSQHPDHAPIFLKLKFAHDFSFSDFSTLDSTLPNLDDALLTPQHMINYGHSNWSSITVGNLRGKFIAMMADYDNFLFENYAAELWQTFNSFLICDNYIWRYQFPFPDFCWFAEYDTPSSTHDEKYDGTLQAQRHGRLVLMNADSYFSQHPDCTPFGTYVRCSSFDGFQTARKWGWSLALQMADTNENGFISLREGSALFESLGIVDEWRIPLELEINNDLVELTYPDATNYPDIIVSHTAQEDESDLVLQSGANLLFTNWPAEIYADQAYVFNFLSDGAEWRISPRMKEELWEIDANCIDDNINVYNFASNSRIPWVTHCDLFALVLEEYHSITCDDVDNELLLSSGFGGSLRDTCCDTCSRQDSLVPFEFEGCQTHDDCESSDYFCASCSLCSFHSVDCPLCTTGVAGVCIPLENCALGVSIDNSCPDYYLEPAKCSKAALLTNAIVATNHHCLIAFNAYYSADNEDVYINKACECFRSADFSDFSCALDHSHHSLAQYWQWCRSSSCESIVDEYICRSRTECNWKVGMVLGYCVLEGTYSPSGVPTEIPSKTPSKTPSMNPGWSLIPSWNPSLPPTSSFRPTSTPITTEPTVNPSSNSPSLLPSTSPQTSSPSLSPTSDAPSNAPIWTFKPSSDPSQSPSTQPSPSDPTNSPETTLPSSLPSESPFKTTNNPTLCPSTPRPTPPPVCDAQLLASVLNSKGKVCDLYRSRITRNLFVTEDDSCNCLIKFSSDEAESFECLASPVETEFLVVQWVKCTAPTTSKVPSFTAPPLEETCSELQMYNLFVTPLYSSPCIKYTSVVLGIASDMDESERCECVQSFTSDFLATMNCRPAVDELTFPEQLDLCVRNPTRSPVQSPSYNPLQAMPTTSTYSPTTTPETKSPTISPETEYPSSSPENSAPTKSPSQSPSTSNPTDVPSETPSEFPSGTPTTLPTTTRPSSRPSTSQPSTTSPTKSPSHTSPTNSPSTAPSIGEVIQYYNSAVTVLFVFSKTEGCDELRIGEINFFNNKGKPLHWNFGSSTSENNFGSISNLHDGNIKTEWGGDLHGCTTTRSVMAVGIPPSLASFSIETASSSMTHPEIWTTQVCDSSCKTFCFQKPSQSTSGISLVGGMIYFAVMGLEIGNEIEVSISGQSRKITHMGAFVFDCALFQGEVFEVSTNAAFCTVLDGQGIMDHTDIFVTIMCTGSIQTTQSPTTAAPTQTPESSSSICSNAEDCISFLRLAYNATQLVTEETHARTLIRTIRALTKSVQDFLS